MRSNAHRLVPVGDGGTCVEVASSPDTPGRPERWQWHIRLRDGVGPTEPADTSSLVLDLGDDGDRRTLEVAVDPDAVRPHAQVLDLADTQLLQRDERELMALVVSRGCVLVEGRHRLGPRDTMVLEGDDPIGVTVSPCDDAATRLAVVLLRPTGRRDITWVP